MQPRPNVPHPPRPLARSLLVALGMRRGRRSELKECLLRCSCGVPCVAVGGAPPTISLVTTHYAEPFGWLKPVLLRFERLDVVIYECCSTLKAPSLAAAHSPPPQRPNCSLRAARESPRRLEAMPRGCCLRRYVEHKLARPLEATASARSRLGLSRAPVSLHQSAAWAALAGPIEPCFRHRCGVSALPAGLRSHPRVRLRDKGGALAQRDPFFSFFDHVVQSYRARLGGEQRLYGRPACTSLRSGRGWPELGAGCGVLWDRPRPAESQLAVEPSHRVFDIGSLSDYTLFMHGQ